LTWKPEVDILGRQGKIPILKEETKMYGKKSIILGLMACIGLILAFGFPAMAAEYPTKPITLVIPFPAGGSTDLTTRALANAAEKFLGQPIIIENKPGGGATVGPTLVLAKPPDGYTIGVFTDGCKIAYHMGKLRFDPMADMTHITHVGNYLYGIAVRADSPHKTIQEFIQYSKQNPKKVSYASVGVGTSPHFAMEELSIVAGGIEWIHIPCKGGAEVNTALLGGHVDVGVGSSILGSLVEAEKFRLLVIYAYQRSEKYPQVPTLKEVGYNLVNTSSLGIVGPKGMPKPIVQKLHDAFKKGMEDSEFQSIMKKFDMVLLYQNSADYEKFTLQDTERIGKLVKKLGLQKK
jgi:tripartite-type tricarboxylate transporter receptor subunit TctC